MINEVQRQAYLVALGIENYMPRVILPSAPPSKACVLPKTLPADLGEKQDSRPQASSFESMATKSNRPQDSISAQVLASQILTSVEPPAKISTPVNAASILESLQAPKVAPLEPFALSLWRPEPGFLIVDSRNTRLALPTEVLLKNLLRCTCHAKQIDMREEVMRWPMVENRFLSRTAEDARTELQTWLAVENELRPIKKLWLMGENAARYLVASDALPDQMYWQRQALGQVGSALNAISALLLPSLNELLQQPLLKARLWQAID